MKHPLATRHKAADTATSQLSYHAILHDRKNQMNE